jgi:hypothetical protein
MLGMIGGERLDFIHFCRECSVVLQRPEHLKNIHHDSCRNLLASLVYKHLSATLKNQPNKLRRRKKRDPPTP